MVPHKKFAYDAVLRTSHCERPNFVVDVFSKMLIMGSNCGLIRGVCPHLILEGVLSLQYADDTLMFLEREMK
jgi:hypothetical protein